VLDEQPVPNPKMKVTTAPWSAGRARGLGR
jgi:hypothetical protein